MLTLALLGAPILAGSCNADGSSLFCATVPNFGTDAAAQKIEIFLKTSAALTTAAGEIDRELGVTCLAMASDLGIPASSPSLRPLPGRENDPGATTDAACTRVKTEIDTIIQQNVPRNAHLSVVATPAVCTVNAMAVLACVQECETVTVTETEIHCKPGAFYGSCMVSCMGECKGTCAAGCAGQCTATCNGTCSGTCNGTCTGTCSARNAKGDCVGTCVGTCNGSCDAKCQGSCSGTCYGSCMGSCQGECHGGCMTWSTPPQCKEVEVMRMRTDCTTACDAKASMEATCTPPSLTVTFAHDLTTEKQEKISRLMTVLGNHLPTVLKIAHRTGSVVQSAAEGYYSSLQGATQTAQQIGLQAGACVANAISASARAVSQIEVSASVSVSISASVTASGGV